MLRALLALAVLLNAAGCSDGGWQVRITVEYQSPHPQHTEVTTDGTCSTT
jgi:hypothetical protein